LGFRSPEGSSGVALAIEPSVDSDTTAASGSEASGPPDPSPSPAASTTVEATAEATPSPSASAVAEATTGTQTATGSAFQFRFGVVQVAVTVEGDQIVDVQAVQLPDGDRHSAAISQEVEPILRESALAVDSADIDVVSGATYTSLAYAYSLQSALDQLAAG
jgi:uncharacterized protein with FMN-binding domain